MRKRVEGILHWVIFFIGIMTAIPLNAIHNVQKYKLLNVAGIIYGLLGVLVLSKFVANIEGLRHFIVDQVSAILMRLQMLLPAIHPLRIREAARERLRELRLKLAAKR
jgi:hypothetical protein